MSATLSRPEVEAAPLAAETLAWAHDTGTDLRAYFDLTEDEYEAVHVSAEKQTGNGSLFERPTCFNPACGVELVARAPKDSTDIAAWLGMWWDHPERHGHPFARPGIGHASSMVVMAPSEHAQDAAMAYVKGRRRG